MHTCLLARTWRAARALAAALPALLLTACLDLPTEPDVEVYGSGPRVLFIGNSNTFYHDVPALVQALAASRGEPLAIAMVAYPNFGLGDHWAGGQARSAIAKGGWAFVVLQHGASAQPESREALRSWTQRFAADIRAVGARPALFASWPAAQQRADFPASIESHRLAAADVDALLLPASSAWVEAWAREPELPLYMDAAHASADGAYLTALVIYARLTGSSVIGLPATVVTHRGYRIEVPAGRAAMLQEAAAAVVALP